MPVPAFESFTDFLKWVYASVPRRGSAGAWISDAKEMRDALTLCRNCQSRMGPLWRWRLQYRVLHKHAAWGRCDGCQYECTKAWPATLFIPEEQGYWQEKLRIEEFTKTAEAHRVEIQDRRRVRLV